MLEIKSVSVTYQTAEGRNVQAVQNVSLSIPSGEIVTVIGPSGCGKSTLLHCMGGLLRPSSGEILVSGERVVVPDPSRAAFVFQDYSLFPWKSVVENAATGLRFAGMKRRERRAIAMEKLNMVGLEHVADSFPNELSGGMQQRVAIARALAMDPEILLLDEPFGALDEQTRRRLGVQMSRVLSEAGKTVVMVTHSLDEAAFWGDHVLVLSKGPGRVVRKLSVDGPRPRGLQFMTSAHFDELRAELFSLLESEVDRAEEDGPAEDAVEPGLAAGVQS